MCDLQYLRTTTLKSGFIRKPDQFGIVTAVTRRGNLNLIGHVTIKCVTIKCSGYLGTYGKV